MLHLAQAFAMAVSPSPDIIAIEKYIHSCDVYRATTAHVILPWPVLTSPPTADLLKKWEQVESQVLLSIGIIIQEHLALGQHQWKAFLFSYSKPGYAKNTDLPTPTMRVDILNSSSSNAYGTWTTAGNKIKLLLDRVELNVDVDMVNARRVYQPSLFGISSTDPMVKLYDDNIRKELLQIIKLRLDKVWECMSVMRIGKTLQKAEYAVVVLIKPFSKRNWTEIRNEFLEIIQSRTCDDASMPHLTVEFLPGEWQYGCTENPAMKGSSKQNSTLNLDEIFKKTSKTPSLGDSIGILDETGGGSLGGFVTLRVGKNVHKCFITNWHVTRPQTQLPRAFKKQAERWGSSYFNTNDPTKTTLQYFAKSDATTVQDTLNYNENQWRKELDKLENEEKTKRLFESEKSSGCKKNESLGFQSRRNLILSSIRAIQNLQKTFDAMPYEIGKVLVSSGQRAKLSPNHDELTIMDWALIELNPKHAFLHGQNTLPSPWTIHPDGFIGESSSQTFPSPVPAHPTPTTATQFSRMQNDRQYLKTGRTSGTTRGTCHGTRVDLAGKHLRYDDTGATILVRDSLVSTREWLIPATHPAGFSTCTRGFSACPGTRARWFSMPGTKSPGCCTAMWLIGAAPRALLTAAAGSRGWWSAWAM